jgi:hypothetical protein
MTKVFVIRYRVLSGAEYAEACVACRLPCRPEGWGVYPPDTGVFLFKEQDDAFAYARQGRIPDAVVVSVKVDPALLEDDRSAPRGETLGCNLFRSSQFHHGPVPLFEAVRIA